MALWYEKNKVVFLSPQRAASTSIEKWLENNLNELPQGHRHHILQENEIKFMRDNDFFSFSVVRNPWARVYSHYNLERLHGTLAMVNNTLPFNEYVDILYKAYQKISDSRTIDGFVCYSIYRHMWEEPLKGHFIPQYDKLIKDGEPVFDYIVKFEDLENEMSIVADQLGVIHSELPLYRGGRKNGKYEMDEGEGRDGILKTNSYREHYSDESRDKLAEVYHKTIEYFNYEF
tara:strand:- start:1478 stop:2170 length:693 start_codon:yes stop_codon:yes gene_type:complete